LSSQRPSAATAPRASPGGDRALRPQRQSSHIAAKVGGNFLHTTDKAMQLKALQNALAPCLSKLKVVVEQRQVLSKGKETFAVADLCKMVAVVGLRCGSASVVVVVPHGTP
jgi:hypothetical protein